MSQVSALEHQLKENTIMLERAAMAERLGKNRDFKKLILEEFCTTECARFAQLSGDPSLKPEDRADAMALAQAAGHLKRYISITLQMGRNAAGQTEDLEAALSEARAEDEADEAADVEDDDNYAVPA